MRHHRYEASRAVTPLASLVTYQQPQAHRTEQLTGPRCERRRFPCSLPDDECEWYLERVRAARSVVESSPRMEDEA